MNVRKLLIRGSLFILGIVLLAGSISFWFYTKAVLDNGAQKAEVLDRSQTVTHECSAIVISPACRCFSAMGFQAAVAKRVISENETQPLTVSITNKDNKVTCEGDISLSTLEFDVSPNTLTYSLSIPPGGMSNLGWILDPKKLGTFSLLVSLSVFGHHVGYHQIGITITNVFGLTIWQAQLLPYVGTFLGTFFGPVLSFTWWYTIWKRHKRRKNENNIHTSGKVAAGNQVKQVSKSSQKTKKKR